MRLVLPLFALLACSEPPTPVGPGPDPGPGVGLEVGQVAPDFTLPDSEGVPLTLSEQRGSLVVIDVSAIWCTSCQDGVQALEVLFQEHGDAGLVPIDIVLENVLSKLPEPADAAMWADVLGLTFPVVADVDGLVAPIWDPDGRLPTAYIIDADGVVVWAESGGTAAAAALEGAVLDALDAG